MPKLCFTFRQSEIEGLFLKHIEELGYVREPGTPTSLKIDGENGAYGLEFSITPGPLLKLKKDKASPAGESVGEGEIEKVGKRTGYYMKNLTPEEKARRVEKMNTARKAKREEKKRLKLFAQTDEIVHEAALELDKEKEVVAPAESPFRVYDQGTVTIGGGIPSATTWIHHNST